MIGFVECQSMATAGFCLFIFFSLRFFHSVNSYPYVFFFLSMSILHSGSCSCWSLFQLSWAEGGVTPWTKHIRTLSYQRKIFHTVQKTSHTQHQLQLKSQSHYKNQLLFSVASLVRISRSASERKTQNPLCHSRVKTLNHG